MTQSHVLTGNRTCYRIEAPGEAKGCDVTRYSLRSTAGQLLLPRSGRSFPHPSSARAIKTATILARTGLRKGVTNAEVHVPGLICRRRHQGAGLIAEGGTSRIEAAKRLFGSLGGTLEHFYFAFGDEDLVVICDVPDYASAAAFSLAINATGMARGRVTVLMTPEEIDAAAKLTPDYRPPGGR